MSKKQSIKRIPVEHTARGFEMIRFTDLYGVPCSVQQSSLAECCKPGASALWIGTDDAQPKILASQAASAGVCTLETTGWVPYSIPKEVQLSTRMHLNVQQVSDLIKRLQAWVKTGSLEIP